MTFQFIIAIVMISFPVWLMVMLASKPITDLRENLACAAFCTFLTVICAFGIRVLWFINTTS